MNARDRFDPDFESSDLTATGEDTLRLIADLPAPEGLADRVQDGLRYAPKTARVFNWRGSLRPSGGWMQTTMARGAAAAAIVCVVAGGGWRIYSRVQPQAAARVLPMPPREAPGSGGFSQSNAKRVPKTLEGPVLTHPIADTMESKAVDKASSARPLPGRRTPAKKSAVRPVVTPMP